MKIIKNLKYFLMLGCLSFATFTFAETTANQNVDKQAVQKQLSKKLNDLSIHIKTLENMLKTINANDLNNNMTNRLGELETKINGLTTNLNNASNIITSHTSTLADLEERIDSIDDDIKTTREVLSNVSSDASTALKKANTALETANLAKSNAKTACDNADLAYNTAITAKDYAFDALNKANTAQSNVKTACDNADLANNTANIALNKANNLTTSYNSLSTKVSNLESSIKTMEVDVSKLNESLGYDIDTIKKIQNDITDLDTKFDRLQRIGSPIKIHWENIRADSKPSALRYNDDTDPTSNRLLGGKIIRGDGRFLPDVMVPITAGVLTNEIEIVTNTTTQATRILDQDYLRILYSNFHKNSLLIPFTSGGKKYDSMLHHSHLSGKLHGTNIIVNTIPGDALQARTVTSAKLANNAVTTNNISPTEFKKIMHSPAYISDPHRTSDYCVVDPNHASATDDQFDTDSSKPYTTLTRAFEVSSRKGDNINVVVVVPKDKSRMFFLHEPLKHARYWTGGQLHLGIRGISTNSFVSAGTADIRIVSNGGRITPYNMYWHIGGHNDGTGKINISFWKTITYNVYTNIYSNNLVSNSKNGYNGPAGVICTDKETYPGKTVYLQRYKNPKTGSGVTSPSSNGEFYINPHYTGIYLENTSILGNIYIASKTSLGVSKSWITTVNELPADEKTKKDFYIYTQIQDEADEYGNMETYHFDIKYY